MNYCFDTQNSSVNIMEQPNKNENKYAQIVDLLRSKASIRSIKAQLEISDGDPILDQVVTDFFAGRLGHDIHEIIDDRAKGADLEG